MVFIFSSSTIHPLMLNVSHIYSFPISFSSHHFLIIFNVGSILRLHSCPMQSVDFPDYINKILQKSSHITFQFFFSTKVCHFFIMPCKVVSPTPFCSSTSWSSSLHVNTQHPSRFPERTNLHKQVVEIPYSPVSTTTVFHSSSTVASKQRLPKAPVFIAKRVKPASISIASSPPNISRLSDVCTNVPSSPLGHTSHGLKQVLPPPMLSASTVGTSITTASSRSPLSD